MNSWRMKLRFWGVRGSTPTPLSQNLGYGGNTSCLEIRLPNDDLFIFDAGTGIRDLGMSLSKNPADATRDIHLFLTHYHWDHIQGIPFFGPLYNPKCSITFYASCYACALHESLRGQMVMPYFPGDDPESGDRRRSLMGPGQVDQQVRQAIQTASRVSYDATWFRPLCLAW